MALVDPERFNKQAQGFGAMPILRQFWFMVAIAASIAIGVGSVLWLKEPSYKVLYSGLAERDVSEIMTELQGANIEYRIDQTTGAVLVPSGQVYDARLKLAAQGLPKGSGMGYELLQEETDFGTSQFIEKARFDRAMEAELARTISTIRNVQSARVHLAMPKQSVFLRNRQEPTASVVVSLFPGRSLDNSQIASIVHMVASSVSRLEPKNVTVVDQQGRLLNSADQAGDALGMSSSQFEYQQRIEKHFIERIEDLLTPIVGVGGVRAQVTADIDFTVTEKTEEIFNPDLPALRSEQSSEQENMSGASGEGVPGTLSNTPPEGGTVEAATASSGTSEAKNTSKRVTRNYELDKTISHTKLATGTIRKLSVAVVVDDKSVAGETGEITRTSWTDEELGRFSALIKEAVGFDVARGDRVNVVNTGFFQPAPPEPLPEPAIWEQPWVMDAAKQAGGVLIGLIVLFGIVRPTLKSLMEKGEMVPQPQMIPAAGPAPEQTNEEARMLEQKHSEQLQRAKNYEENINTARTMVNQDPQRVAQVVKNWMGSVDE